MGIIVTLRTDQNKSFFKDAMMEMYNDYNAQNPDNPITEALICSG